MPLSFLSDFATELDASTAPPDASPAGPVTDNLFQLSGSVGELGDNARQDVIKTQVMLGETGHFDVNSLGGPTGWPSSTLSRGLRRYQQDRGLTVDGIMLPNGETLRSLGSDLPEMKRYRAPTPQEVDRQHALRARLTADSAAAPNAPPPRRPAKGLELSPQGLEAIKEYEAMRDRVYPDQAGHKTIGYGHKLRPGEEAKYPGAIDEAAARELLAKDIRTAEAAVRRLVTQPLTQQEYDALISLTYNIGQGGFAESTVLKELNKGDYRAAAEAMMMWDKITAQDGTKVQSNGLVNRRNDERNLFLNGSYNSGRRKR